MCTIPQLISMLQMRPFVGTLKFALGLNHFGFVERGAWAMTSRLVMGGMGLSPSGEFVISDLATLLTQCLVERVWSICSLFEKRMWKTSLGLITVAPKMMIK